MKTLLVSLFSVLALVLSSASGFAADKKKNVQYRKTQSVEFESSDVDGKIHSPDGAYVNPKKSVKFMPLYKLDQQFDKEIKDSVEYLK